MYTMYMSGALGELTQVSEPLELDLQLVISYNVGARNRTQVFWESIHCPYSLSSLFRSFTLYFELHWTYSWTSHLDWLAPDSQESSPLCFLSTEITGMCQGIWLSTWILRSQIRTSCLHMCYFLVYPALQAWKPCLEFLVVFVCCSFLRWCPTMYLKVVSEFPSHMLGPQVVMPHADSPKLFLLFSL